MPRFVQKECARSSQKWLNQDAGRPPHRREQDGFYVGAWNATQTLFGSRPGCNDVAYGTEIKAYSKQGGRAGVAVYDPVGCTTGRHPTGVRRCWLHHKPWSEC